MLRNGGERSGLFQRLCQKGISYDEEMEIITQKGKRVWVRSNRHKSSEK